MLRNTFCYVQVNMHFHLHEEEVSTKYVYISDEFTCFLNGSVIFNAKTDDSIVNFRTKVLSIYEKSLKIVPKIWQKIRIRN